MTMRKSTATKIARADAVNLFDPAKGKAYVDPVVVVAMYKQGFLEAADAIRLYVLFQCVYYQRLKKGYYESVDTISQVFGVGYWLAWHALARARNLERGGKRGDSKRQWKAIQVPAGYLKRPAGEKSDLPITASDHLPHTENAPPITHLPSTERELSTLNTEERDLKESGSGEDAGATVFSTTKEPKGDIEEDIEDRIEASLPPINEDLLRLVLSSCQEAHPDVHVHGFMGAPGALPLDMKVAAELCEEYPLMTLSAWRRAVAEWLMEAPGKSDNLTILNFKRWFRQTTAGSLDRRRRPPRNPSLAAWRCSGLRRGRESGLAPCKDRSKLSALAERQLDELTRGMAHVGHVP